MGVIIGPQVLGLHVDPFVGFFSDLGLGLLFFFAGYELDIGRIMGQPLRLGLFGWALSLALAYTIGGILAATGIVLSLLYTGSALATTAIGMLIPILSDTGELKTRFGTYLHGAGAVGEFGPILLLTLFLSSESTEHNAVILVVFIALAVCVAVFAVRSSRRTLPLLERTLESSAQLAVRWIVVLQFALALLAFKLGLDLLLGGFAAGLITRHVLGKREIPGAGFEALGGRVRPVRAVLLHRRRDEAGHQLDLRRCLRGDQSVPVPVPVPGRARHARNAALQGGSSIGASGRRSGS